VCFGSTIDEQNVTHTHRWGKRLSTIRKRAAGTSEGYSALPYHLLVVRDGEDRGKPWTASVEELPGCTTRGRTADEALSGIEAVMANWISVALAEGREIPEPRPVESYSGRLLLRMPRTLHAELTRASDREGVSLNQFITDVLAAAVAWRGSGPETPRQEAAVPTISQAPGADGLTAQPSGRRRSRREGSRLTNAALTANFVLVGMAAIVAIIVLIAAAA
jgi:predicted RNase H-like HicB family nuclease